MTIPLTSTWQEMADIAIATCRQLGAGFVDFRFEDLRKQQLEAKEVQIERVNDFRSSGYAIRVLLDGRWGFAASNEMSPVAVANTARRAIAIAKSLKMVTGCEVHIADEPPHVGAWQAPVEEDPFSVDIEEKIDHLLEINKILLEAKVVKHCNSWLDQVKEIKYLVNSEGTETTQERTRIQANFETTAIGPDGQLIRLRSDAVPAGKGYEYVREYDFLKVAEEHPHLLEEKVAAPSVDAGSYDLVVGPTNLWLTIHESIGHATELDRILGYEANYAGTSFVTTRDIGQLRYGSDVVNVIADRTQPGGLSTVAWDDDGVEAQEWSLITEGLLTGYQFNREIAAVQGFGRSVGCAFADSWQHIPIQRMPNISLQPSSDDISIEDLISDVKNGIYIVGDDSWSIDMKRLNFQFTGQRFYRIRNGKLAGMVKNLAYQGNTIQFWNSCVAVGGPSTYVLCGAFNCGKGQPGQVAPVSHGTPAALFRNVNVLNTDEE